jgi:hypothetical protein
MRWIVLVATVFASTAHAQDIPDFDVERECEAMVDQMGGGNFLLSSCLTQEQKSYDWIKAEWSSLDGAIRKTCINMTSMMPTYFLLRSCIEQEIQSGKAVRDFKFRR